MESGFPGLCKPSCTYCVLNAYKITQNSMQRFKRLPSPLGNFVIGVRFFIFLKDMTFTHAFDLKMTGKKFKLEEKSTFKHVLLFIKTKVTASFDSGPATLKLEFTTLILEFHTLKLIFFSTLKLLS